MRLSDQRANSNPYDWNDRTHAVAHHFIQQNFDDLHQGQVIDVRTILGKTLEPAPAEIIGN